MVSLRVLPTGWAALGFVLSAAAVAFATGDNRAFWLLATAVTLAVVDGAAGAANFAGVTVARRLPDELFAGHRSHGALVLRNAAPFAARAVRVRDPAGGAEVAAAAVPARGEAEFGAAWTFDRRGAHALGDVEIASAWPFGLFERRRRVPMPADLLVYPRPVGGAERHDAAGTGDGEARDRRPGDGEFAGLRPYVPGDPPRRIHWPTTARFGAPMVITRAGQATERCLVRVDPRDDRERALARACGEVVRAFSRGAAVGLDLPSRRYEARPGDAWRRALLEALAREPA